MKTCPYFVQYVYLLNTFTYMVCVLTAAYMVCVLTAACRRK